MKTPFNKSAVDALAAPARGNIIHHFAGAIVQGVPAPRGFGVRVTAKGAKAFILGYSLGGVERRMTIGQFPEWSPLDAVKEARKLRQQIDRGEDPLGERNAARGFPTPISVTVHTKPTLVADVVEEFIKRHVSALRTARSVESALRRHVLPVIGATPLYDLRRRHIAAMLDQVEMNAGPVAATRVVAYVTKCFNWHATRDDEFTSPMIKGMARSNAAERARDRVLSDDEIRAVWTQAREAGVFGAIVRTLLLTGQRRDDVASMRRGEIAEGPGPEGAVWTIPAARYKTKRAHVVPLGTFARELIAAQPAHHAGPDVVFPSALGTPFSGFDKPTKRLREASGTVSPGWTLHDLRRTAKTLMARAGVRPDVSERVIGHTIRGVEGVYDRHSYLSEKRAALDALAAQVTRILHPSPVANVVALRA